MAKGILVWDAPVRLFHWALAVLAVFSYATAKVGGAWMAWHLRSGYAILALLLFRVAWGFVGSDTARFSSFLRGPRAVIAYARRVMQGRAGAAPGHNPMGGWMVVFMLAVLAAQVSTGLFADDEIATQGPLAVKVSNAMVSRMSAIHSVNQWVIVGMVALHLAAVFFYERMLGARLVAPMIHGRAGPGGTIEGPRIRGALWALALFALACAAVYYLVVIFPRPPA